MRSDVFSFAELLDVLVYGARVDGLDGLIADERVDVVGDYPPWIR